MFSNPLVKLLFGVVIAIFFVIQVFFINSLFKLNLSYNSLFPKNFICEKCNVILVSLDTLSAEHLPCYGYNRNTAPNLCKFANDNIIFPNSYSQTSNTLPSHISIFTSLYPTTHKVNKIVKDSLDEKYLTLAQILRLNNYQTIYYGPLNDSYMPLDKGIGRGFNVIEKSEHWGELYNWPDALDKFSKEIKNKPTFLFLHTYAVHSPYLTGHKEKHLFYNSLEYSNIPLTRNEYIKVTKDYLDFVVNFFESNKDKKGAVGGVDFNASAIETVGKIKNAPDFQTAEKIYNTLPMSTIYGLRAKWYSSSINANDPKQVEYLKALYDEKIFDMDLKLNSLFSLISTPGVADNTILIITSDHGEEFMEKGSLFHGSDVYKVSTHVPLIMYVPGIKKKSFNSLVQGIDIYPTILGLLGIKQKSHLEGVDLTKLISGKKNPNQNNFVISDFAGWKSIMSEEWRFYQKEDKIELYNMDSDPQEINNVAENNTPIVKELFKKLQESIYGKNFKTIQK